MRISQSNRSSVQWYIDRKLTHSIHTSSRRSFRSCRRRWDWAHRQRIFPKVTPPPLEFGVAFHSGMEKFYDPITWNHDFLVKQALALEAFSQECDEQLKKFRKLNGEPGIEQRQEYDARKVLGLNMIKYYTLTVSPIFDQDFTPVRVEVAFEVPIYGPSGEIVYCTCAECWLKQTNYDSNVNRTSWKGLPTTYGGRLDMLAKDKNGRYWVYDWKTTSRLMNEEGETETLDLDDQISSYVWALRDHYGIDVAGFVYVEIKKAYPQVPEKLQRSYKGRAYSTSKTHFTTYKLASEFFAANDTDAYALGAYDDYLQWLRVDGPKFHQRHQIHKTPYECEQIGLNIYYEACDMIGSPRIYPTPGRFSCSTCAYRTPCIGQNSGEDYTYTLKTLFDRRELHYFEAAEIKRTTD